MRDRNCEAKMIHDLISTHIFSWLSLSDIAAISRSSKDSLGLIQNLLSIGLITEASVALHHLTMTQLLCERIHNMKPLLGHTGDTESFLRNMLNPVRNLECTRYDIKPRVIKKVFQLCPRLQVLKISHPTSAIIRRFKPMELLSRVTLGQIGFSNIKCSDESFRCLLSAVGHQLIELNIKKLNCLTIKSIEGITKYCGKLEKLSVISCNGIRATSSSSRSDNQTVSNESDNDAVGQMLRAIAPTIVEIDVRYSIEMNDGLLQDLIENSSAKRMKIFLASRTTQSYNGSTTQFVRPCVPGCGFPEKAISCRVNSSRSLTTQRWAEFVDKFRQFSSLLYIDNIGSEGNGDPLFLFRKCEYTLKPSMLVELYLTDKSDSWSSHSYVSIPPHLPHPSKYCDNLVALPLLRSESGSSIGKVVVPLDDDLFKMKKRTIRSCSVRDTFSSSLTSTPNPRHCKNLRDCLQYQAQREMSRDKIRTPNNDTESKYFTNTMSCATRVSVSENLDLSDGGFVDDIVDLKETTYPFENFRDGVDKQLDTVLQDEDFRGYRSKIDCMCTFLPSKSNGGRSDSSRATTTEDLNEGRERGHIARNLTFIRLI